MTDNYKNIVENAFKKYSMQAERPGYPKRSSLGFFCLCPRKISKTQNIIALEHALANAQNEQIQKQFIIQFLKNNPQKNNNFSSYLLDELIENRPNENWEQYNSDHIAFYQPTDDYPLLYRGDMRHPQTILNRGFKSNERSNSIEDYADPVSHSLGISTTKSLKVAKRYSTKVLCSRIKEVAPRKRFGYVYIIDPRGLEGGVDIMGTFNERPVNAKNKMSQWYGKAESKQEVNFISDIPPENIVGCLYFKPGTKEAKFTANKKYQALNELTPPQNEVVTRKRFFTI